MDPGDAINGGLILAALDRPARIGLWIVFAFALYAAVFPKAYREASEKWNSLRYRSTEWRLIDVLPLSPKMGRIVLRVRDNALRTVGAVIAAFCLYLLFFK